MAQLQNQNTHKMAPRGEKEKRRYFLPEHKTSSATWKKSPYFKMRR